MPRAKTKAETKHLRERIKQIIQSDPDITNRQLVERLGCTKTLIQAVRKEMEVPDPGNEFLSPSDFNNSKVPSTVGMPQIRSRYSGFTAKRKKEK